MRVSFAREGTLKAAHIALIPSQPSSFVWYLFYLVLKNNKRANKKIKNTCFAQPLSLYLG
jgi:hypothetical protein